MSDEVCLEIARFQPKGESFVVSENAKLNSRFNHSADEIIQIFNDCFIESYDTELIGDNPEPEYIPSHLRGDPLSGGYLLEKSHTVIAIPAKHSGENKHAILFTKDYFASALHEISHWCIAGEERRTKLDYGYWYCPDGRTEEQQSEFEKVEVKPQALEWLFAEAAGFPFRLSFDNLNGRPVDAKGFADNVHVQAIRYLQEGVNKRSKQLIDALLKYYRQQQSLDPQWFEREKLGYLEQ